MRREVVVCGRGVGLSLYAAWELKQRLNESGKNLVQQDLVHIHVLKDFNHMVSHLYHDVSRHLVDDASVTLGSTPTICRNACQSCLNSPRFASLEYLLSCVSNASRSQFNQNILMISRVRAQVPCGRRSQAWRYAKSDGDAFCPKCPYGSSSEPHSIAYRMLFGILSSKPSPHSMR